MFKVLIKNMQKIAIDIVLLPDTWIDKICREFNFWLTDKKIDFNWSWKNPHISLMMWLINENEILKLQSELMKIFSGKGKKQLAGQLEESCIPQSGEKIWYYEIKEKYIPKEIFEKLIAIREQFLTYKDINTKHFFTPKEVENISTTWVKWFENRTQKEYTSHITLGIWEQKATELVNEIYFETPRLAVFQLWNYCTCEKLLFEINL